MIENALDWILANSIHAPWIFFFLILLAGFNIPISIDLLMVASGVLAATTIPQVGVALYLSMFIGSCLSAWIAYWMGKKIIPKLHQSKKCSFFLSETKIKKIETFYQNYSYLTFIVGRFIPFGVRNAIFMTAGATNMPFSRFVTRDALACFLWSTISFCIYYLIGLNYKTLSYHVKIVNFGIFGAFGVTVIALIWYKRVSAN